MEKTYNARLSFKGEGSFTFTLPGKGEVTIYQNKDIYVKGLSVSAVEALRELRPLLLDHKLNASPVGCYSVIDLNTVIVPKRPFIKANEPKLSSISDLKSSLIKSEGPIIEDDMNNLVDNLIEDMKSDNKEDSQNNKENNDNKDDKKENNDNKKENDKSIKSIINKSNSRGKGRNRNRK